VRDRLGLLLVGVGGQGVLTAARILGDAAHQAGHNVVVGQLHGMAQRGGSLECTVLIGPGQSSFLEEADILLGFEPLEVLRARNRITPATKGLVNEGGIGIPDWNRHEWPKMSLDDVLRDIHAASPEIVSVDAARAARRIGVSRTLNIFLLGALAGLRLLPFDAETLWNAVSRRCSPHYRDVNRSAFELGQNEIAVKSPSPVDTTDTRDEAKNR